MSVYKGENVIAGGSVDTYFVRKPAWSQAETVATIPFTAPKDGILLLQVGATTGHGSRTFSINGVLVATVSFSVDAQMASCSIQVNAGDVLTSNAGIWGTYKFVPFEDSTIAEPEVVTPEYIRNQNILSDVENVTMANNTDFTCPYAGEMYFEVTGQGAVQLLVNNVQVQRIYCIQSTADGNATITVNKGDIVKYVKGSSSSVEYAKARWYKLRDYGA